MTTKAKSEELHDRATRGEILTTEEQSQLQAWYHQQDQTEFQHLGLTSSVTNDSVLHDQISVAIEQLTAATAQIQKLAAENETLHRETLALRRQLSGQPLPSLV
jgi:type VI protein secretion system component Hcp